MGIDDFPRDSRYGNDPATQETKVGLETGPNIPFELRDSGPFSRILTDEQCVAAWANGESSPLEKIVDPN